MKPPSPFSKCKRVVRGLAALAALLPLMSICEVAATADPVHEGPDVMRVEQDWEAVLNEPGSDVDAPQFHSVISPYADLDSYYLQISWNYREQYDFTPGGMQLQAWWGDYPAGSKSYRQDKLSTTAETITWTQSMQTDGSLLRMGIDRASSTTWGTFGGTDTTLTGMVGVQNLNGYSTSTSVVNSWITYGSNRVNLLRINEVRYYDCHGNLIWRDTTPKIVFQLEE